MSRMRIGILTFTEGYNYGNKLQNYALLKYLENNFPCEVKTINNYLTQGSKLNKLKVLLIWAIPSKKHYMYWKRLIRFKVFNKSNLNLTKEKLTNGTQSFNEVDVFVCGSDQIWNPNYYEKIDMLMGKLPIPKRSISYAASFGVDEIPHNKKESFSFALGNLDAISVREEQGVVICQDLGYSRCRVNIDPTFLCLEDEWLNVLKKPRKKLPEKYVVTYFLGTVEKEVEELITEYCRKYNIKRVDLNSVKNLEWFDITPFEFLYLIKNSEIVFTDSFHASVFSIIFNKKFLTIDRVTNDNNQMNSRIDTLFLKFACKNHRMSTFDGNFDSLKLDAIKVKNIIQDERNKTYNYILSTLFN